MESSFVRAVIKFFCIWTTTAVTAITTNITDDDNNSKRMIIIMIIDRIMYSNNAGSGLQTTYARPLALLMTPSLPLPLPPLPPSPYGGYTTSLHSPSKLTPPQNPDLRPIAAATTHKKLGTHKTGGVDQSGGRVTEWWRAIQ